MLFLCYHLTHAIPSFFQTLGLNNDKTRHRFDIIGWLIAIVIFVGYSTIPAAILLKLVTLPEGGM